MVVIVLAVLVCWWLSDEPAGAAPPAAPPVEAGGPIVVPSQLPVEQRFSIGGGPLPVGYPLPEACSELHSRHLLVTSPSIARRGPP